MNNDLPLMYIGVYNTSLVSRSRVLFSPKAVPIKEPYKVLLEYLAYLYLNE